MAAAADRNLVFGLLALQNGLIDQDQLVAAFRVWSRDKSRQIADYLVDRGDLDADQRNAVAVMLCLHEKKHGGSTEKSLAAIPAGRSTRESLAALDDSEIEETLARAGSGPATSRCDDDPERTGTYSVGSATSNGERFRILRPHARGGLGAVFVALDGELHREVALKQILEQHADDPVSRHRFVVEAEITGGLEHPGVVPVYGLGTDAAGRPYYAMRFIKGDSLKEAIARFHDDNAKKGDPGGRSLELRKLLRRFTDVCYAIDYAHSRGVIHRDVKPANIIVGKHGETLVVDWGLAKAVGRADPSVGEHTLAPSSGGSSETLPGSALGTPAYMSPEQARGELERLGPRSDVYSLGATLYCLLTGKPPFGDDDVGVILRAVEEGRFQRPSQRDPALDKALEAVCVKAMATRPEDRYATPNALADDLERWMADEPVTAWREPFSRRARRWARRNRTAVTSLTAALLVALAGTAAVLAVQTQSNRRLKSANSELAIANGRVTKVNVALESANERERQRFDLAMEAIKLFHGEVSEDLLLKEKQFEGLRAKLLKGAAGFYAKLEGLLKVQTDRPSRAALARAYQELAELTDKIGSKPEALAVHRKALAVRRALAGEPEAGTEARADVARSLVGVGWLQERTGDMAGALALYEEALRLAAATDSDERTQAVLGLIYMRIGRLLEFTGRQAEAAPFYQRALAIHEKLADAHPDDIQNQVDLAQTYHYISHLLVVTGKQTEAARSDEHALAIRQRLADAYPSNLEFQSNLASSYETIGYDLQVTGESADALAAFGRQQAIAQKLADANPNVNNFQIQLARSHEHIGWGNKQAGRPAEALAALERATAIYRKLVEIDPTGITSQSHLALCLGLVGGIRLEAGRHAEAAAALREAVAILERLPTLEPVDRYNLACGHAKLAGVAVVPGSGMAVELGRAEADLAMQWLDRAVAAGYRNVALMRWDSDLDPIRSRPDFQLLLLDLAFPKDPFARDR